jgi:hypothetical protein
MTIFDVLSNHHRVIDAMFRRVQDAAGDGRDAELAAFTKLSTWLLAVMRVERTVVYPVFARDAGLPVEIDSARRDHDQIERAIHHIRLAGLPVEAWRAAVARLRTQVSAHRELKELILAPLARARLAPELSFKLVADFASRFAIATAVSGVSITYEPSDRPSDRSRDRSSDPLCGPAAS